MRTEILEPVSRLHAGCTRNSPNRRLHSLEPHAVDAAMEVGDEAELLENISQQLDLLREQERSILRLLDRAGHLRLDGANV
jgi:hypothetical protein